MRVALGALRGSVVGLLFRETLVLFVAGAAAGTALSPACCKRRWAGALVLAASVGALLLVVLGEEVEEYVAFLERQDLGAGAKRITEAWL